MRLLIFIILVYLAYKALKAWLLPTVTRTMPRAGDLRRDMDDVMIKDPYCEAYFHKRNGVSLKLEDTELFFCSPECRDKFIAAHSENRS
jgi:hypothetical protein